MSDNWVMSYSNGLESVEDLDGVSWHKAPVPRRFHCCRPQTRGRLESEFRLVERCACGATRLDGSGPWMSRRRT